MGKVSRIPRRNTRSAPFSAPPSRAAALHIQLHNHTSIRKGEALAEGSTGRGVCRRNRRLSGKLAGYEMTAPIGGTLGIEPKQKLKSKAARVAPHASHKSAGENARHDTGPQKGANYVQRPRNSIRLRRAPMKLRSDANQCNTALERGELQQQVGGEGVVRRRRRISVKLEGSVIGLPPSSHCRRSPSPRLKLPKVKLRTTAVQRLSKACQGVGAENDSTRAFENAGHPVATIVPVTKPVQLVKPEEDQDTSPTQTQENGKKRKALMPSSGQNPTCLRSTRQKTQADKPSDEKGKPGQAGLPAITRVGQVLKLTWSSTASKAASILPALRKSAGLQPPLQTRRRPVRKVRESTPDTSEVSSSEDLPSPRTRRGAAAKRSARTARRSLFRKCKKAVSLAKQLASGSESDSDIGGAPPPPFSMRMRLPRRTPLLTSSPNTTSRLSAERMPMNPQVPVLSATAAAAKPVNLRRELMETQPPIPRLIVRLRNWTTGVKNPSSPIRTAPPPAKSADGEEDSKDGGAANPEGLSQQVPDPKPGPLVVPTKLSHGMANGLLQSRASKPEAMADSQKGSDTVINQPRKRRKMCHPAGSTAAAISKQGRLFPELPPKLVGPDCLFSIPPVTRFGPGAVKKSIPSAGLLAAKKPLPGFSEAPQRPKNFLPRRLLRQARDLAQQQKRDAEKALPRPAAKQGVDAFSNCRGLASGDDPSGKPYVVGLTVDWKRLERLLGRADESSRQQLWMEVKAVMAQHSLRLVSEGLRTLPLPSKSLAKLTAGISYVLRTDSKQTGVADRVAPLPHTVIRPPVRASPLNPTVEIMLSTLKTAPVLATLLPLRDDAQMKQYLLEANQRISMLASNGGTRHTIAGAVCLDELLADRTFVCLHYHLNAQGRLEACKEQSTNEPSGPGIADSNVQIGLTVRRGVGGTCPARLAGRKLSQLGILPALLDQQPPYKEPPPPQLAPQPPAPRGTGVNVPASGLPSTQPQQLSSSAQGQLPRGAQTVPPVIGPHIPPTASPGLSLAWQLLQESAGALPRQSSQPVALPRQVAAAAPAQGVALLASGTGILPWRPCQGSGISATLGRQAGTQQAPGPHQPMTGPVAPQNSLAAVAARMASRIQGLSATAGGGSAGRQAAQAPAPLQAGPGSLPAVSPPPAPPSLLGSLARPAQQQLTGRPGNGSTTAAAIHLQQPTATPGPFHVGTPRPPFQLPVSGVPAVNRGLAAGPPPLGVRTLQPPCQPEGTPSMQPSPAETSVRMQHPLPAATRHTSGGLSTGGAGSPADQAPANLRVGAKKRRERNLRPEEWLLAEEEGFDELLEEVDTMLKDPKDPDYDPNGVVEDSTTSSSSDEGEEDSEHRSEARSKAVRGAAVRMLAAGHLTGHPRLRLYSRSCRLEMYVSQALWESLSSNQQSELMAAVVELETTLGKEQLAWNRRRLLAFVEGLQASVGTAALHSPLGRLLMHGAQVLERVQMKVSIDEGSQHPVRIELVVANTASDQALQQEPVCPEVKDVCVSLLDAVCASAAESSLHCKTAGSKSLPSESLAGAKGGQHAPLIAELQPTEARSISEDVRVVLDSMLQHLCEGGRREMKGPKPCSTGDKSKLPERPEDAQLMHEHNTLLALASAAATTLSMSRSVLGEFPWPYYFIGTRDCFTYQLVAKAEVVTNAGREFMKRRYFFPANQLPENYHLVVQGKQRNAEETSQPEKEGDHELLPAGITTYTEVYTEKELQSIESCADGVDNDARSGKLPVQCFHNTQSRNGNLKRTKFFFGARYLWTHEQLSAGASKIAGGVRVDVPPPYTWMKHEVETPLVGVGLLNKGFVDSWALNLYHDGSEGIQSHFDDAGRFQRPITSLRLMSDSRLSFGTQLYGYTNGAFYVDMPRGCVTVMEEGGYAATGLKHCVRPVDMTGRSAALIMRKIRPEAMAEAAELAIKEAGEWLAALTLREGATPPSLLAKMRADTAAREQQEFNMKRDVWRVLDSCIRTIEVRNRSSSQPKRSSAATQAQKKPSALQDLASLVSQVERLVMQEVRQAETVAQEVQTVLENCILGIEKQSAPRQSLVGPYAPPASGIKASPLPLSPETCRLLQLTRLLTAQLTPATVLSLAPTHYLLPRPDSMPPVSCQMPISAQVQTPGHTQQPSLSGVPKVAVATQGCGAVPGRPPPAAASPPGKTTVPLPPTPGIDPSPRASSSSGLLPGGFMALLTGQISLPRGPNLASATGRQQPAGLASLVLPAGQPLRHQTSLQGQSGGAHSWLLAALQKSRPSAFQSPPVARTLQDLVRSQPAQGSVKVTLVCQSAPGVDPHVQVRLAVSPAPAQQLCHMPHSAGNAGLHVAKPLPPMPPKGPPLRGPATAIAPTLQSLIAALRSHIKREEQPIAPCPIPPPLGQQEALLAAANPHSRPVTVMASPCDATTLPSGFAGELSVESKPGAVPPQNAIGVRDPSSETVTGRTTSPAQDAEEVGHSVDSSPSPAAMGEGQPTLAFAARTEEQCPRGVGNSTIHLQKPAAVLERGVVVGGAQASISAGVAPEVNNGKAPQSPGGQALVTANRQPASANAPPVTQHPGVALSLLQRELVGLVNQLQAKVNKASGPSVKVKPMKASQYRALAKSMDRASKVQHGGRPPFAALGGGTAGGRPPASDPARLALLSPSKRQLPGAGACWRCYKPTAAVPDGGERRGGVWSCAGACRRSFHDDCCQPASVGASLVCLECYTNSHLCAVCKEPRGEGQELVKCSMSRCGLFFHRPCAMKQQLTHPNAGGSSFRCPRHYCAACGKSGDSIAMVHCMRCYAGYHCRCRPIRSSPVTKKLIICDKHS